MLYKAAIYFISYIGLNEYIIKDVRMNINKNNVELIYITPLWVADMAIGVCWDKQKPVCDIKRMDRIANKFKHRSTIEHIHIIFTTHDYAIASVFRDNNFSIATPTNGTWVITTNMRALGDMRFTDIDYEALLPEEYLFLVTNKPYEVMGLNTPSPSIHIKDNYGTTINLLSDSHHTYTTASKENASFNFHIKGCSRAVLQELARHRSANLSVKSSRYTLNELKHEKQFKFLFLITKEQKARANEYLVFTGHDDVDRAAILALENLRRLVNSGKSIDKIKTAMPEAYRTELVLSFTYSGLANFLQLRLNDSAWYQIRSLARHITTILPLPILEDMGRDIKIPLV